MSVNEGLHQLPGLCYPPSDSDDESFVVLERSLGPDSPREFDEPVQTIHSSSAIEHSLELAAISLSKINNSDLVSSVNVPSIKSKISFNSCEMSDNEIQEKVDMLIDENNKLKETLVQNNMVMKKFQNLKKWQEEVERVHRSHRENFAQTKIYIENLQKENKRLIDIVNSNDPGVELKLETSKKIEVEILKNLKLAEENEILKQQILTLQQSKTNTSEEFAEKRQKYLEQITNLKIANENLKLYENFGEEIHILRRQLMEAQMSLTQIKSHFEEKEQKYLDEIKKLSNNDRILKYSQEIKELQTKLEQVEIENKKYLDLEKKYNLCLKEMSDVEASKKAILDKNKEIAENAAIMSGKYYEIKDKMESFQKVMGQIVDEDKTNGYLKEIDTLKEQLKISMEDMKKVSELQKQLTETKMSLIQMQESLNEAKESKKMMEIEAISNRNKIDELQTTILEINRKNEKMVSLENQYQLCIKELSDLKASKEALLSQKNEIAENAAIMTGKYYEIQDKMESFKSVMEKIADEDKTNEYLSEISTLKEQLKNSTEDTKRVSVLQKQLAEAEINLNEVQESLNKARESKRIIELEAKANRNKIDELQSTITEINRNNDRTVALENQLEIYKLDFEAERSSKEKILEEKNKIVEDLRILQNRNEQLISEVETLRSKCTFVEVTSAASSAVSQPSAPSPPPTTYSCPLCLENFRSYRMVEEHVQLCINNSI